MNFVKVHVTTRMNYTTMWIERSQTHTLKKCILYDSLYIESKSRENEPVRSQRSSSCWGRWVEIERRQQC